MGNIVIMNGKDLADDLLTMQRIKLGDNVRPPCLVVITVGDDDASIVYVRNKRKACELCGITFIHEKFSSEVDRESIIRRIKELNYSKSVDGILIQQPVPDHIKGLEQYIDKNKDVDGFTATNLGETFRRDPYALTACTPTGIITMLRSFEIPLSGKHVVIVGRSNIVGKPLIGLLLNEDCTVTSCNSKTEDLLNICRSADIIISAVGKPNFITAEFLSAKCYCVVDVGINRNVDGTLCGDVNFDEIIAQWNYINDNKTRYITPVPKGVGPMTVYSLIKNVNLAYTKHMLEVSGGI